MHRRWFWALLAFLVIILLLGVGNSFLTYQRVARLSGMKTQMDETLTKMSQLANDTYYILYESDNIRQVRGEWKASLTDAYLELDKLSEHPGLQYVDSSISQEVIQIRNSWESTIRNFFAADQFLDNFLNSRLELKDYDNVSSMVSQVSGLSSEVESNSGSHMDIYELNLAFLRLKTGTAQLRVFITSAVEELRKNVQDESDSALENTLALSGVVLVVLLLLIAAVLIFSLRILRRANMNLEEQVNNRTKAIQNLLDFSGVGYITFGPDLIINPEISRECIVIFGRSIVGENIAQVLFSSRQKQEDFADAMALVFSGRSQPEVVFDVLDSKTYIDNKIIEMSFRFVDESTIIGQLRDISETEKLQKALENENSQREMVLKAVTSKRYFLSILGEAEELFAALEECIVDGNFIADEEKKNQIIRDIHTFKANASFLRMMRTSKLAHSLEDVLIAQGILSDEEPLGNEIPELKKAFNDEVESVVEILGQDWLEGADKIEISLGLLEETRNLVRERYPDDEYLIHAVDVLSYLPLSILFKRLGDMSRDLAATNGKKVTINLEDNDISVTPEQYQHLLNSLNHILRNTVTHGIEFPRHREKAGKKSEGNITLCSTLEDNDIHIRISDDGAGISVKKINERARELGWVNDGEPLSLRDSIKMIFKPGFSTADTVTAISGRGFGLSAVKELIYQIGGRIKVSTAPGRGTSFIIVIPNERKKY